MSVCTIALSLCARVRACVHAHAYVSPSSLPLLTLRACRAHVLLCQQLRCAPPAQCCLAQVNEHSLEQVLQLGDLAGAEGLAAPWEGAQEGGTAGALARPLGHWTMSAGDEEEGDLGAPNKTVFAPVHTTSHWGRTSDPSGKRTGGYVQGEEERSSLPEGRSLCMNV